MPVRQLAIASAFAIGTLVMSLGQRAPGIAPVAPAIAPAAPGPARPAPTHPAAMPLTEPTPAAVAVAAELRYLDAVSQAVESASQAIAADPPTAATDQPAIAVTSPAPPAPAPAVTDTPAASYRNQLTGPYGLGTSVGTYADCQGRTPLPSGIAAIDTCVHTVTFFVGHNAGVFTPLVSMGVGDVITYWDGAGVAHPLRVISVRNWLHTTTPSIVPGATAQFQTCLVADGSVDRVLDAAPA